MMQDATPRWHLRYRTSTVQSETAMYRYRYDTGTWIQYCTETTTVRAA